ncbi:CHAT domain-containing protein [Anaerolineales bacterium HSG25]|nr:CHAT domain-containing protein [Anaerolineales bacterium HSG25]
MLTNYTDLIIMFEKTHLDSHYEVTAIVNGAPYPSEEVLIDLTTLRSLEADAEAYGELLFKTLFQRTLNNEESINRLPHLKQAFNTAARHAQTRNDDRLRIHLDIKNEVSELQAVRWERLYYHRLGQLIPLSISAQTPFSRYLHQPDSLEITPLKQARLKLLIAIANPKNLIDYNLTPIDVGAEIENLWQALSNNQNSALPLDISLMTGHSPISTHLLAKLRQSGWHIITGDINPLTENPNPDLPKPSQPLPTSLWHLKECLADYDMFHFIGHGAFGKRNSETALLFLEDGNKKRRGQAHIVEDEEFQQMLAGLSKRPRLMFFVACESAKRHADKAPHVGLAPKIVQTGVPAVVAMQEKITIAAAQVLSREFYRGLLTHGLIDRALNHARFILYEHDGYSWDIPALFMNLKLGQLLSANPVCTALKAMQKDDNFTFFASHRNQYLDLPIEVLNPRNQTDLYNVDWRGYKRTALSEAQDAITDIFIQKNKQTQPRLVALIGGHGSNKSTQLKRLVWDTVQYTLNKLCGETNSMRDEAYDTITGTIFPLYVDLVDYPEARSKLGNPIKQLIVMTLQQFWPGLTEADLPTLLGKRSLAEGSTTNGSLTSSLWKGKLAPPVEEKKSRSIRLWLLFDGSDELPEREREPAWQQILELIHDYPDNEYVLASTPANFSADYFVTTNLHMLIIQNLDWHKVYQFLESQTRNDASSLILLKKIEQAHLFDLARVPWFLIRMIRQARAGDYPDSRTEVLQRLVKDAIATIPAEQGMRGHAEKTIYELAWKMHRRQKVIWPVSQAFQIMTELRGNREYNLESLYEALVDCGLLTPHGEYCLRFTYLPIQSYCCAQSIVRAPDRTERLDDIVATFGRLTRLRWWEEGMIFVTGLMVREQRVVQQFMRLLVYGIDLLQSDQTFLATQCMLELKREQERLKTLDSANLAQPFLVTAPAPSANRSLEEPVQQLPPPIDTNLLDQIINALIWRLDSHNEPRLSHRTTAALLLGQLAPPDIAPELISLTREKIAADIEDEVDYDFASMAWASALAIRRMMSRNRVAMSEVLSQDTQLKTLFALWQDKDMGYIRLIKLLNQPDVGDGTPSIAGMILGDVYNHFRRTPDGSTPRQLIFEALRAAFFKAIGKISPITRWCVTQALAMLESKRVIKTVIKPFLEKKKTYKDENYEHYKCMAYLIGQISYQDKEAYNFLLIDCLGQNENSSLWVLAIEALGYLTTTATSRKKLESIATGEFFVKEGRLLTKFPRHHIQRKAFEALGYIGNEETLARLQQSEVKTMHQLQRAFYRTSEEIYWRLQQQKRLKDMYRTIQ